MSFFLFYQQDVGFFRQQKTPKNSTFELERLQIIETSNVHRSFACLYASKFVFILSISLSKVCVSVVGFGSTNIER